MLVSGTFYAGLDQTSPANVCRAGFALDWCILDSYQLPYRPGQWLEAIVRPVSSSTDVYRAKVEVAERTDEKVCVLQQLPNPWGRPDGPVSQR